MPGGGGAINVEQGHILLAGGADGGCFLNFSGISFLFSSPSLWETARYS